MSTRELRWSEEQVELSTMLATLLSRHCDSASVRAAAESETGYDARLWALLCEQVGVAALLIPEEHGGAGFGFPEVAVVLEQLGRALAPSPMLGTVVATTALLATGDDDACGRILPGVAAGELLPALAWSGPRSAAPGVETVSEQGGRLHGDVTHVLDGAAADLLLVVARTGDGTGLFEVAPDAPGLRRLTTPTVDQTLRLATVTLDDTPAVRLGGDVTEALQQCHATARAAVTALQVGVAQRGLDMTVAYSKERSQFGRTIGSFQALKHRMADLLVLVETSRSAAMEAALSLAAGDQDAPRRTAVAKAWCSEALDKVAAETIQLHGGIAITWEHDAHLVFKRAHALGRLFGAAHEHRAAVLG